jgi:GR25 family glycosyltransferase involved in LPS biosynthesis
MKITDFFDKTVCINLDRRFDRWSECVTEFDKNKLVGIERFKAVDGKSLAELPKGFLTTSRLALVLTNMLILDKAIEEGYNSILILEDDVEFTNQVNNMKSFFDSLPEDWDMLYFGGNHNTHVGSEPPTIINDKVCKLHNTFSTHCVAINKKAFKALTAVNTVAVVRYLITYNLSILNLPPKALAAYLYVFVVLKKSTATSVKFEYTL